MKNLTICIFFIVVACTESMQGQFSLGVSAGVNRSNVNFETEAKQPSQARYAYFIVVVPSYKLNDKIRLQLDAQHSLKGFDQELETDLFTTNVRFTYLDFIPEVEYSVLDNLALGQGFNYGIKINEEFRVEDTEMKSKNQMT